MLMQPPKLNFIRELDRNRPFNAEHNKGTPSCMTLMKS